jgi:hypothetical protein
MNRISTFRLNRLLVLALLATLTACANVRAQGDPLPSWNDGPAKQAIVEFVKTTTDGGEPEVRAGGGAHRRVRPGRHAFGRAPEP